MMSDIQTIMWKEWKEILSSRGSRSKVIVLILVGILGILLPLQTGRAWVESPAMLVIWAWVPLFLVSSVIADSFAGERERHTLETLLASRISDQAILFGKVLAAVGYGVAITWLSVLLGLLTVNLAQGHGPILLYSAPLGLGIVAMSLLGAGLSAGAGVLVSLRASTARQAQQTLSIAMMVLLFGLIFGIQALPASWRATLLGSLASTDMVHVVIIAGLILLAIDAALLVAAMARFRRARLILD